MQFILICETFQMTYCLVVYAVPNRSYAITGSIFSRNDNPIYFFYYMGSVFA